jgi:hypothetical protein
MDFVQILSGNTRTHKLVEARQLLNGYGERIWLEWGVLDHNKRGESHKIGYECIFQHVTYGKIPFSMPKCYLICLDSDKHTTKC